MKKKLLTIMLASVLAMATLASCGNSETMSVENDATEMASVETTETPATTEAPHEHTYTEEVTTSTTCLEEGEKTFTCECGDTYTEAIPVTGHDFAEYVSNEDATYEADGTETATCSVCGETDTRVTEGSMLTYTFEDMEATKYAKSTVNVRSLPTADGEKLGGLSTNDEVKVTGKCNETGWYRIEYSDSVAYVSDSYLVNEKIAEKAEVSNTSTTNLFPYELHTIYSDEKGRKFYYLIKDETFWDYSQSVWEEANAYNTDNNLVGYFYYTNWKTSDGRTIAKYAPSNLGCPEHE